jgi:hypothetical protein
MVNHICEPICPSWSASCRSNRALQGGGREPLTQQVANQPVDGQVTLGGLLAQQDDEVVVDFGSWSTLSAVISACCGRMASEITPGGDFGQGLPAIFIARAHVTDRLASRVPKPTSCTFLNAGPCGDITTWKATIV